MPKFKDSDEALASLTNSMDQLVGSVDRNMRDLATGGFHTRATARQNLRMQRDNLDKMREMIHNMLRANTTEVTGRQFDRIAENLVKVNGLLAKISVVLLDR